jgi:Na+-transporting NADH:ubiquinone oxidoreductase subunit A
MGEFKLKRGYDIPIAGEAQTVVKDFPHPQHIAIIPYEFRGFKPRLNVKIGDMVKVGTPLCEDKKVQEMKLVSSVSGKVVAINRGERRMLMEVVVENDKKYTKESFKVKFSKDISKLSGEDIKGVLMECGLWPLIIQRPFIKVANPADTPRDIFISGFNTAPLAANIDFILQGKERTFQLGLDVLNLLTSGNVYLSLNSNNKERAKAVDDAEKVEKHYFKGPHPAGNVGVQIHHIAPINQGEIVWTVKAESVVLIGELFERGDYPNEKIVAIAGSALKETYYAKTISGAPIAELVGDNIAEEDVRFINGDVLNGYQVNRNGYIGLSDSVLTIIPEGKKERKLLGYFRTGINMSSFSKTFLSSWLTSKKKRWNLGTLSHGAQRAFIQTGIYEKVLPMDILPSILAKSILAEDIEEMESLGILELAEEDLALCTYICPSKTDFGAILRQGLDLVEKEG